MASRKDYYDILGIRRGATEEEIEKAFRKLARTYQFTPYPLKRSVDFRFREISEAYEILSNKEKREKYDRSGSEPSFSDFFWEYEHEEEEEDSKFDGFEDIFEKYFPAGNQISSLKPQKGEDLHCHLKIAFQEAICGRTVEVMVQRKIICPSCSGMKTNLNGPRRTCDRCAGAGQISIGLPPSVFSQLCPQCLGRGRVPTLLCEACRGKGLILKKENVFLQIPPGVEDRCRIYLTGGGQPGKNGGPQGDFIAFIEVSQHPYFKKIGDDLHVEVPLTFWEAALGDEVKVPTLEGFQTLSIPPGVQSGEQVRLPGMGVPFFNGEGRGDLVVSFTIVVPRELDEKSKELLEQLKRRNPINLRKQWRENS